MQRGRISAYRVAMSFSSDELGLGGEKREKTFLSPDQNMVVKPMKVRALKYSCIAFTK